LQDITIYFPSQQLPGYIQEHLHGRGEGWGVGKSEEGRGKIEE
jgi:hypothetical protein